MTATAVQPETAESTGKAVALRPKGMLLRPIAQPRDILVAQEETRALIQETLKEGRDYGKIPGIDKPSLLKPGAERVGMAFGCFPRYRIVEQEIDHDRKVEWRKKKKVWNNAHKGDRSFKMEETTGESLGLYRYVVECEIVHRESGAVVGSCIGVCSTMEAKYVDRPRECENTALKIAEKRAHVGAVLNAFGLSEQFTQDVEDNPDVAANGSGQAAAEVQVVKDLAWAKAFPLPFPTHKHSGEPIDTRETKELEGFLTWATNKIIAAGQEGSEPSTLMVEFKEALTLILTDRKETIERDQTKLDLAPTSAPSESTNVKMPPPGKVADALEAKGDDPTSSRALHKKAKELLDSPAISEEDKAAYHQDNVNGFKKHPHAWWIRSFENDVRTAAMAGEGRAATAPGDSFPEALKESDDDLPF